MYGIPNCDTIKKARNFLETNSIEYDFHDYKKQGISAEKLKHWCDSFGFEKILNRRGTTWRKLDKETQENINQANAIILMQELPSMIKRPILETSKNVLVGFDQSEYESLI